MGRRPAGKGKVSQVREGIAMMELPDEDETPFSLPGDAPEVMPIDYPALDSKIDAQEAYDEGLEGVVDTDPYMSDDDPIRSVRRMAEAGAASRERYTVNHEVIRRWTEYRYGHPARIKEAGGLLRGGLYIRFEDDEPDVDIEPISWKRFFAIFEDNNLAFLYRTRTLSGGLSRFHQFLDRVDVSRVTDARRIW